MDQRDRSGQDRSADRHRAIDAEEPRCQLARMGNRLAHAQGEGHSHQDARRTEQRHRHPDPNRRRLFGAEVDNGQGDPSGGNEYDEQQHEPTGSQLRESIGSDPLREPTSHPARQKQRKEHWNICVLNMF